MRHGRDPLPASEEDDQPLRRLTFIAALVVGVVSASATTVTITSFTAGQGDDAANFTTDTINASFDSTHAWISNNSTISCGSFHGSVCSGIAADFRIIGSGLTTTTPFDIHIDGSISFVPPVTSIGTNSDADTVNGTLTYWVTAAPSLQSSIPFSVSGPTFNSDLSNTVLPPENLSGAFDVSGTLSLTLQPGQTIVLPSSLQFTLTPAAVPEPSGALLLAGAAGLAWLGRRRLARRV